MKFHCLHFKIYSRHIHINVTSGIKIIFWRWIQNLCLWLSISLLDSRILNLWLSTKRTKKIRRVHSENTPDTSSIIQSAIFYQRQFSIPIRNYEYETAFNLCVHKGSNIVPSVHVDWKSTIIDFSFSKIPRNIICQYTFPHQL